MHFWIDKRSQVCSLSRNRYGPSPNRHRGGGWSGAGVGGCKVGGLVMVTPVHRFQPIESVQAASAGLRRGHHHRPRLHNHGHHNHHHHAHQASSLLQAAASSSRATSPNHASSSSRFASAEPSLEIAAQDMSENSELVGSARGGGGMSLLPHGAVGPGLASQQQVLLRLPAPQREVFASGRLKCGLWATLALISFSVAAARFYSDHKGSGLEILYLMVCALLLLLLCCGCMISLCSAGPPRGCFIARTPQGPNNSHDLGPRSALIEVPEEDPGPESVSQPALCVRHQMEQSSLSDRPIYEAQESLMGGEPPPYHIAIWLPQPEGEQEPTTTNPQEVPPPSYDKATS
ncbi:uncharacterized protein LOC132201482 isoform X2 [Neocloeon triangulifer]|uniref:uncharacterized protein LOC132201482 isoform X2 n=1 Tax=Neocloeon triangulifer TaxID=2078957 RepID=UPI00286FA69F|nr:uncharacterized protein LOC132201482 isoform X2 [Neocloeon triangulifer]